MTMMLHQVIAVTGLARCRGMLLGNDVVVLAGDEVAEQAATMDWPPDCRVYVLADRSGSDRGDSPEPIDADQWVRIAAQCELNMVWT